MAEMDDESCSIGGDGNVKVCKGKSTKKAPFRKQKISTNNILDMKIKKPTPKNENDIRFKKEAEAGNNTRYMGRSTEGMQITPDQSEKLRKEAAAGNEPFAMPKWKRKN